MKYLITIIFTFLTLVGMPVHAELNVFACEPEWAALAKEIGSDKLTIYSATTAMQDPHRIQARPSLIAKARKADLLLCTGAELETGWLPLLLRKSGNAEIQTGQAGSLFVADYVNKLDVPKSLDRSRGDVHAEGNPHVHTDPENILLIADVVQQRLSELDPVNAAHYALGYQHFREQWTQHIERWKQQAVSFQGINIVTYHTFWAYMNHWLGINVLATLESIPGVSPSSSHLSKVKKQLADHDVKMIIHVSYVSDKAARWIAGENDLPVIALPATVDFQDGQTLSQWFDDVMNRLSSVQ